MPRTSTQLLSSEKKLNTYIYIYIYTHTHTHTEATVLTRFVISLSGWSAGLVVGRGSSSCRSSGKTFFSRVNFLSWLLFHLFMVAHKRSPLFRQKCRWQVTAKHTCILHAWFWMTLVQGCTVYMECVLRWQQCRQPLRNSQTAQSVHHFGGHSKTRYKRLQSLVQNHMSLNSCT